MVASGRVRRPGRDLAVGLAVAAAAVAVFVLGGADRFGAVVAGGAAGGGGAGLLLALRGLRGLLAGRDGR
jgi:hypothetical protein